jgi:hypothetical protein
MWPLRHCLRVCVVCVYVNIQIMFSLFYILSYSQMLFEKTQRCATLHPRQPDLYT